MNISSSKIGFINIITPRFPLVEENIDTLKQEIQRYFQESDTKILIDFSRVSHIDSRGLEFLLDIFEEAKKKGSDIKLCNLNQLCNDIFLVTRMINFFEIYKEPEEAAQSYL